MLKKIGRRWALVSIKDPNKVLKWFGTKKPTSVSLAKEEKRVQYYKNLDEHMRE